MDIKQRIAKRTRSLRSSKGLSLEELAARSGVSRSNISIIERGEGNATASVLEKLSAALGVTLSSFFEEESGKTPPSPLLRSEDQLTWKDPASGYIRRDLSPAVPSPLQLVAVIFPGGATVTFNESPRERSIAQQVWILDGVMEISVAQETWSLQSGDCLAMDLDQAITFHNPTRRAARYLVALDRGSPLYR